MKDLNLDASLVGFSPCTEKFTESFLRSNVTLNKVLASAGLNGSTPLNLLKELYQIIHAKKGDDRSRENLIKSFTPTIKFWANQNVNNYLFSNDEFFWDLINEGYLIVSRRIDNVDIEKLLEKEKVQKNNTTKTWFQNNTALWIRSYLNLRAKKLKKLHLCREELIELKDCNIYEEKKLEYEDLNLENIFIKKEEDNFIKNNLKDAISQLTNKQKEVIKYLYLNKNNNEKNKSENIKELSKKLNVSDKRIYFIHSEALKSLKKSLPSLNNISNYLLREHV